ncbi:MAG: hypothetical protein MRY78_06505 [Saprospiraceae bacterium]|nr:hypothetical protein [Saprospiraceae bacterium]
MKAKINKKLADPISLGFLLFLTILMICSQIFWKERTLILDASFQSFLVIANEAYAIMLERYGAIMTQSFPLILAKIGTPLAVNLKAYSLSFTLYPIMFFVILWRAGLRPFAWLIGLYFLLITSHTFFWIQSEFIQGTVLAIFAFGVSQKPGHSPWMAILPLLLLFTIYTHPLTIVVLLYGFGYLFVHHFNISREQAWASFAWAAFSVGIYLFKNYLLSVGDYDATSMGRLSLSAFSIESIINSFFLNLLDQKLLGLHLTFTLACTATLVWLFIKKKIVKALLMTVGVLGWFAIVLTFWDYHADDFHFESFILILSVFVGLPIVLDIIPQMNWKITLIILACFVIWRIGSIVTVSRLYQKRVAYIEQLVDILQQKEGQRFMVNEQLLDKSMMLQYWGLPFETIMVSCLEDPEHPKNLLPYPKEVPEFVKTYQKPAIMTAWGPYDYYMLRKNDYFQFSDTTDVIDIGKELLEHNKK